MNQYIIHICVLIAGINVGFVLGCMWARHRNYAKGINAGRTIERMDHLVAESKTRLSAHHTNPDYPE